MAIGTSLYDEEGAKIVPEITAKAKSLGTTNISCAIKYQQLRCLWTLASYPWGWLSHDFNAPP